MFIKEKKDIDLKAILESINIALALNPQGVSIKILPYKDTRTNNQNNYYWLVCGSIKDCLNNAGVYFKKIKYNNQNFNVEWDADSVHETNKLIFGVKTTASMTRGEFSQYMEKVFNLWIEKTKGNWVVPIAMNDYFRNYE